MKLERKAIISVGLVVLLFIGYSLSGLANRTITSNSDTTTGGTYTLHGDYAYGHGSSVNFTNATVIGINGSGLIPTNRINTWEGTWNTSGSGGGGGLNVTNITNSKGHQWTPTAAHLQQAIWDLNTTGGKVWLPSGTITLTSNINIQDNVTIQGVGDTSIFYSTSNYYLLGDDSDIKFADFKLTGKTSIRFQTGISNIICDTIDADVNSTSVATFYFYVNDATMSNIKLVNCHILNSSATGFMFNGDGTVDKFNGVLLEDCSVKNCGRYPGRYNDWVTGFDLSEGNSYMENLTVVGCKAEYSWESGFHFEESNQYKNINLINCISNNNGQKVGATYGTGYLLIGGKNVQIKNCVSFNNSIKGISFYSTKNKDLSIIDCSDFGSKDGLSTSSSEGHVYINGFTSKNETRYGVRFLTAQNITTKNLVIDNPAGDSSICSYFGSSLYPLQNSSIEVYAYDGGSDVVVLCQGDRNDTFSGYIKTNKQTALSLSNCQDVIVKDMVIDCSGSFGILSNSNYRINISDTVIKNSKYLTDALTYGVYNASGSYPVIDASTVSVSSIGITTAFSPGVVFAAKTLGNLTIDDILRLHGRTVLPSPALEGQMYYSNTAHAPYYYNGSAWVQMGNNTGAGSFTNTIQPFASLWNYTRSVVSANSNGWNSSRSVIAGKSATWNITATNLNSFGFLWNLTRSLVSSKSAAWNTSSTNTIQPFAAGWNNTKTRIDSWEGTWNTSSIGDILKLTPRATIPTSPSEGWIFVNSTSHHILCYLNGVWVQLD